MTAADIDAHENAVPTDTMRIAERTSCGKGLIVPAEV